MCTLSFIADTTSGFKLTSNRDESTLRLPALPPLAYLHHNQQLIYPKDSEAGGTWLAVAENGFVLCLLNGAFTKHERKLPYRQSRGLVIPQFFEWGTVPDFVANFQFTGIEPFTLIIINTNSNELNEVRWNGSSKSLTAKDWNTPHIWSSATLYEPSVVQAREVWFQDFLSQNKNPNLEQMLHFHHFGGNNDSKNRFLMNRENHLQTVSITGIEYTNHQKVMIYEDLLTNTTSEIQLK